MGDFGYKLSAILVLCVLLLGAHAQAKNTKEETETPVIITLRASEADFHATKEHVKVSLGKGQHKRDLKSIHAIAAKIDAKTRKELEKNPLVERIEPDERVQATLANLDEVGAPIVWQYSDGTANITGTGVRIAIIDTGVDYTHSALGGCFGAGCKVAQGYDFVNGDADPLDDNGHGTHVAGTAAGSGVGVAPGATLYAYKALDQFGDGYSSTIIAAIERATDPNGDGDTSDHVDIISMSLGGTGCPDDPMARAVDQATAAGVLSVIAAGNSGPSASTINSPGVARTAVTVAAGCDASQSAACSGGVASFSSRGPLVWQNVNLHKPDVTAPGVSIYSTWPNNAYTTNSGTSMATPHVAGEAALIKQAHPEYTPVQLKSLIKSTARSLDTSEDLAGTGMIAADIAVGGDQYIESQPAAIVFTADPSERFTTYHETLTITSRASPSVLDVYVDTIDGLAIDFDTLVIDMAQDNTLVVDVTVDNDELLPGNYTAVITLMEEGVVEAVIPVLVTVVPSWSVDVQSIDYGYDSPWLTSWSAVRAITLTNYRTDSSQAVSITASTPIGVTFQTPTPVILAPGETRTIDTTILVDNNIAYNGQYTFTITATSGITRTIQATFAKLYHVVIEHPEADPLDVWIHESGEEGQVAHITTPSEPVYLYAPGPYDIVARYSRVLGSDGAYHDYTIFMTDVEEGSTVTIEQNQATHEVQMQAVTTSETLDRFAGKATTIINTPTGTRWENDFRNLAGNIGSQYVSDVSPDYEIRDVFSWPQQPADEVYYFYASITDLDHSDVMTNDVADMQRVDIDYTGSTTWDPLESTCRHASLSIL